MRRRVEVHLLALGEHLAGEVVDLDDPLDLVPEEVDPHDVLAVRRLDLEDVAADPELRASERRVVALVLEVDEVAQDPVAPVVAAPLQLDDGRPVIDRSAEPVDGRNGRHDHHVSTLEQRARGVVPQPVDLLVPGRSPSRCTYRSAGRYASGWK